MARPATSWGNSMSSPAITLSRPWTRAIPSPREMTVPTSSTWMRCSKFSICWRSSSVISSALICAMSSFYLIRINLKKLERCCQQRTLRVHKPLLQLLQLRADGAVIDRRPDAHHGAAQQGWILMVGGSNTAAGELRHLGFQVCAILIVQGMCAGDLGLGHVGLLIGNGTVFRNDLVQFGEPLVVHDDGEKVSHLRKHTDATGDRVEDFQFLLVGD